MKQIYTLLVLFILTGCSSEQDDKQQILEVMELQQKAWSDHNIEGFMASYWESDSLKFYGSSGLTKGWQNTLDNYKKAYPTPENTGTLEFIIDDITKISDNSYYVMGQYKLLRTIGDANGVFMIIFKKINGEWKIVADLSC